MKAIIEPGRAAGTVQAPPSKSINHRMLICSGLTGGLNNLSGVSGSRDIVATMGALSALGAEIKRSSSGSIQVRGTGAPGVFSTGCNDSSAKKELLPLIDCGESGSTLRFLIPVSLLFGGGIFKCAPRLMERGISVYEKILPEKAVEISSDRESCLITVSGFLQAGSYVIPGNISSQFATGLLLALPLLPETSRLIVKGPVESRPYINITLDVMRQFGVHVKVSEARSVETDCCDLIFTIPGRQQYKAGNYVTEGDWSNAAFLYALKKIKEINHEGDSLQNNSPMTITGLNPSSSQGDRICPELMDSISLRGTKKALDISGCPDLGPVLMAFGAATGGCYLTGTERLRIKESDRGQVMAQELAKFGIEVHCGENDIIVFPGKLQKPAEILRGHNDHRIVMSLAVLSTITGGTIDDAEAVSKSWPDFWHVLFSLGIHVDLEN